MIATSPASHTSAHVVDAQESAAPRKLALAAMLLVVWGILCHELSREWSINEQYSYGWFVPFFSAYLFWLRWERRPNPEPPPARGVAIVAAIITVPSLLLLVPVRLFEIASPDWRVLGWLHAAIAAALTFLLIWRAGGTRWMRFFAFPVSFFFVAVPWILTIEAPVVQGLMRIIAAAASETLTLFGIPAQVEGSVIHINNGLVGVNEACSGVRSLQTSVMIALLLGELKMLSVARRIGLVVGATALALFANFGRSFFLVWMAATRDITAVERWHDTAGYSILFVVFCGAVALAHYLGRGRSEPAETRARIAVAPAKLPSLTWITAVLVWCVAIEVGAESWFRWNEAHAAPQPRWTVQWPNEKPGFHTMPIDDHSKRDLRFDSGGEVAWNDNSDPQSPTSWVMFFFRWNPGTAASILRARGHRPEFCLPNAGWHRTADNGFQFYPVSDDFALPLRHYTFERETANGSTVYAETFFCVYEDRATSLLRGPNGIPPDGLVPDGIRGAPRLVRDGIRNPGQQVLELIMMSAHREPVAASEARVRALVPQIVQLERDRVAGR